MTGLYWIVPTLQTYGGIALPLAIALTSLLAAYLALFHAVFALAAAPGSGAAGASARLLVLPALWVALEWLRTYLAGGFPWNLAGYAWVEVPGALPLSAWIGAYGISFLVVLDQRGGGRLRSQRRRWEPAARRPPRPRSCSSPSPGAGACGRTRSTGARCRGFGQPGAPAAAEHRQPGRLRRRRR